jgi:hypothetical protein
MEVREGQSAGQVGWVEWREAVVERDGLEHGHALGGIKGLIKWQKDELGVPVALCGRAKRHSGM